MKSLWMNFWYIMEMLQDELSNEVQQTKKEQTKNPGATHFC